VQEPGGSEQAVGEEFFPLLVLFFVSGDEEPASFCIEDNGDSLRIGLGGDVFPEVIGGICGDCIQCVNGNDF